MRSAILSSAIGLFALISAQPVPAASTKADATQSDVPAGILLTRIKLGDGPVVPNAANSAAGRDYVLAIRGFAAVGRVLVGFTDAELHPFYTLAADCAGDCLMRWRPVPAASQAQPVGEWTIVTASDGARQWAFRGKPVFTFAKEKEFKDNPHIYYTREPPGRVQQVAGVGVDGAVVAEADPGDRMKLPVGVTIQESLTANGMILASGPGNAPLYAYAGNAPDDRKLKNFRPLPASMADRAIGDFSIRTRPDGSRQWTYRGQPLFSFDADIEPGDVNGTGVVPGMMPAVVFRFYTPADVVIKKDERSRGLLTEAKTGRLLYVRDRLSGGGGRYGPERLDPIMGKAIGINGCDADCEKEWKPFLAPKDAQPRGHWTLYDRPDGTKQWAYRTYALYTHPTDVADTVYGTERVDVAFDGGFGKKVSESMGTALIFKVAAP
jgi:predicted lipoprotein with Yx(FWY)xxD motif